MNRRLPLLFTLLALPVLVGSLLFVNQLYAGTADICPSGCTYVSIQDAVTNGPENTPLTIAAGTFTENVSISRSVILVGAGSGQTIIDGNAADSVIMISGAVNVSISGVTIRNGDASGVDGGGLLNEGSTVTLSNSVVENNLAPNGAGITNDGTMTLNSVTVRNNTADELVNNVSICNDCAGGGILNLDVMTVTNSIIHGNKADFGGGIDNAAMGHLTATNITVYDNVAENTVSQGGGIENLGVMSVTGSEVRNNTARNGAGLFNEGTLTVSSSNIHDNTADGRGGGLHNSFSLTVQTSNIHHNQAGGGGGGGISTESGTVVLDQSAVYSNTATGSGGGIVNNVDAVTGVNSFTITNSTISGNGTAGQGGGLRNAGSAVTHLNNVTFSDNSSTVVNGQTISVLAGTVTAKNTIIAISGSGSNCSGTVTSQGYNIVSDNTCQLAGTADLKNTNPRLGPLQNNGGTTLTHALLLGSPAINSGSGCPAVDQRGVARPFGPACERGAYEYDQVVLNVYLPLIVRP
ncbi:MAG: hypothetical protein H6657_14080 [Ardenticatenaceae bacterium]|nr:hypothetical protein [Ardenticatenaceae bacterium]